MPRFLKEIPDAQPPDAVIGNDFLNNSSSSSNGADADFDTNMVIILAALLCALICALGLNTIARCALRCGRRVAMEQQHGQAAGTGLKRRALRKIPVEVYRPGPGVPETECPICLGDFADGEKVRVLPNCHHGFHVRCIDTWLAAHPSCPTCRSSIVADRLDDSKREGGTHQPGSTAARAAVDTANGSRS